MTHAAPPSADLQRALRDALDAAMPGRGHLGAATRSLERALTNLPVAPWVTSLVEGGAGVAWVAQRLAPGQVDGVLAQVDAVLRAALSRRVRGLNVDLFQGVAGMRAPRGGPTRPARRLAHRPRARTPRVFVDARSLADDVARWMLAQRHVTHGRTRIPDAVRDDGSAVLGRAAYYRGDLGAALSLVRAGAVFERHDWRDAGVEVARGVASMSDAEAGVVDACVCHGAMGQALCFHRLAAWTGDATLAAARDRWRATALSMRRVGRGVAGFRAWDGGAWVSSLAWLNGAAGVARVLVAVLGHDDHGWDAPLGTDIP